MPNFILQIRLKTLQYLFKMAGFENIRGHWVYIDMLQGNCNIIDLGANRGDFTKLMMQKVKGNFFIVEANKILIDEIDVAGVQKINNAVTATDGPVKFYTSKNHEASSILENFESRWGNENVVEVEGVSWKSLMKKIDLGGNECVDVLKIDIEGAELDLIGQFDAADMSKINQLTIEFHDWLDKSLHLRTVTAIKKLTALGYVSYTSTPNHNWPLEILFIKKAIIKMSFIQNIILALTQRLSFLNYN